MYMIYEGWNVVALGCCDPMRIEGQNQAIEKNDVSSQMQWVRPL